MSRQPRYYAQVPEGSGSIVFGDPRGFRPMDTHHNKAVKPWVGTGDHGDHQPCVQQGAETPTECARSS